MFRQNSSMNFVRFLVAILGWMMSIRGSSSFVVLDGGVVGVISRNNAVRSSTGITGTGIVRSSSLQEPPPSSESMQHDIEEMKAEAIKRLHQLSVQMEDLKNLEHSIQSSSSGSGVLDNHSKPQKQSTHHHSLDSLEGDMTVVEPTTTKKDGRRKGSKNKEDVKNVSSSPQSSIHDEFLKIQEEFATEVIDCTLLEGTRWKIVFNIHREAGTWMPKSWGASGDRLLFEVIVDFTDEQFHPQPTTQKNGGDNSNSNDDFLQGIGGSHVLQVVDAWTFPVGIGAWGVSDGKETHGRHPIAIKPTGAYKVLPRQGPAGTDIVRFYIDLEEPVMKSAESDVYCPQGRIYATCGYFPIDRHEKQKQRMNSYKELLADEQRAITLRYEQLQRENDEDERLFSFDQIKRMKQMHALRKEMDRVHRDLQNARQREPERNQMRLSRKGTVGLSREGGVCCKVPKGLAVEYHILGRIELASVNHDSDDHDEYEDLVHKLHP